MMNNSLSSHRKESILYEHLSRWQPCNIYVLLDLKVVRQALVSNVDKYEIVSKQTWCNLQTININWVIMGFSSTLHFHIIEPTTNTDILKPTCFCNLIYMFTKYNMVLRSNSIPLLPGYEGNSTFVVPKVSTSFRGNDEENCWYREDN
jgi:hypothetical protein